LEAVQTQFALIRFALSRLSKASIREFFHGRVDAMQAALDQYLRDLNPEAMPAGVEIASVKGGIDAYVSLQRKKARKDSRPSDHRFRIELSEDRLNQSELLLLVAHFESFMKEVHHTLLLANPLKAFGKSEKEVKLKEVFLSDADPVRPFDKFFRETVIKEVKRLDSQKIDQKAEYFQKHFGISFGSADEIAELTDILKVRNQISHEIYKRPPNSLEDVSDQLIVSDQTLSRARWLFYEVPRRCIDAGARDYPSYFRS